MFKKDRFEKILEECIEELKCLEEKKQNVVVQKRFGREFIEESFAMSLEPDWLKEPYIQVYEVSSQVYYDEELKVYWRDTGSFD